MLEEDNRPAFGVSRRCALAVGAAGFSTVALAACSKAPSPATSGAPAATTANAGGASSAASGASSAASGAKVLAQLSDVPVGGALSAKGADGGAILIIHPTASTVAAFSAICPHMGCTVPTSFQCPCHGSTYDPKTGALISGPAPHGLDKVSVAISGQDIVAG
jgi:cytochrome b6-f complex iron-sulfur subunit